MCLSLCSFELGQLNITAEVSTDQSVHFLFLLLALSLVIFSALFNLPCLSKGFSFCSKWHRIPADVPGGEHTGHYKICAFPNIEFKIQILKTYWI